MTISSERSRAIKNTRQFLLDLLDRSKTKRVPSEIRKMAYWCLRHYPADYEVDKITKCKKCREILG